MRNFTLRLGLTALLAGTALTGVQAQSDEAATLRVLAFGGDAYLNATNAAIARFQEDYPNVTVEMDIDPISNGWGEFVSRVLNQFAAGQSYDVYNTAIETFQAFSSRGLFQPLDDRIEVSEDLSGVDANMWEMVKYNEQIYYIPGLWENIMINYNQALFDEAGVDYPRVGWTWEQFAETAQALTERDDAGNITQFGYEVPNQFFFVQPWFMSNGTSLVNEDWTQSNLDDPKVAETMQYLYDLIHEYEVSPIPGNDTMDNQFMAGQVAMISRGHWIVQAASANDLALDVVPPPVNEQEATVLGFGAYGISSQTEHPDLAFALLEELVSAETQMAIADAGAGVPGDEAAISEAFLAYPPSADLYYQTLAYANPVPSPANFQELEQIFIRHYRAIMSGESSIEDGLAQAHEELNSSFERTARQVQNQ